ncbi:urea ABC transporter permease subunit UrtB [Flammeovirga sp. SJP92]|uniref:urea ABC transporter permease subunit UrtB n=1 Tax=Flammeovirga sp. SJP92 TaxID=1775430 RepID=UPI000AF6C32C|nr:urea ABC transporter permease subunit UrtB [Flammeovirga sp. SJP92]
MLKSKLLFLTLILGTLSFTAYSFEKTVENSVQTILSNNKTELDSAVNFLVETKTPHTYALIGAVLEKRLYVKGTKAYTLFPGIKSYYEVYPEFKEAESDVAGITPLKLSRKYILKFRPLSKYTQLYTPVAQSKLNAYQRFKQSGTLEDVAFLTEQLKTESDEKVKAAGNEAIYTIWLLSGNEQLEMNALAQLGEGASDQMLDPLEQYLKKKENAPQDQSYILASELISTIQARERFINTAQNLFSGISLGSILLLVALGLGIIYGLAGVINMSHGEFLMIGAYTTYVIQQCFISYLPASWFEGYFWVSLPLSFITAGLIGLLIERLIIRHLYNKPLESLLGTWGLSLIMIQICRSIFGDITAVKSPELLSGGIEVMDGLILPFNRLFIIGLTVFMGVLTYIVFFKSRLGVKIRAVTQNRNMSACLGISTKRIDAMTFFLGSGLAGIAGCAMTLIGNVVPNMGKTYIVDSFLIVVVGGVGKLVGIIASAMGVGVLSKIFESFYEAVYGKVIMLAIIIFFLQFKPKGLFPDKGRLSEE